MTSQFLISLGILAAITIPVGIGLIILLRNEMVTDKGKTGGDGFIVIISMLIIFVVLPVFVFFSSL
jgi:hypothetical protein